MTRYLQEKVEEIKLARGRGKNPNADADDLETRQMRGVTGKLNWELCHRDRVMQGYFLQRYPIPRSKILLRQMPP
eukprot:4121030-Karenia_brevis.AAC.1